MRRAAALALVGSARADEFHTPCAEIKAYGDVPGRTEGVAQLIGDNMSEADCVKSQETAHTPYCAVNFFPHELNAPPPPPPPPLRTPQGRARGLAEQVCIPRAHDARCERADSCHVRPRRLTLTQPQPHP